MASEGVVLRCQRIGCNATFTEDNNPDDSCTYHASGPLFHDGMKEWSCCKKKSHDFSLFLEIPGCMTGKHTTEKPVLAKPATAAAPKPAIKTSAPATNVSAKDACPRCRQGFFCSDHGAQVKNAISKPPNQVQSTSEEGNLDLQQSVKSQPKKIVDINQPQNCKNQGCGQTFKEIDNHETACNHHPGPAVFHDRLRGWKCCDVHVKEFDEFMTIPPCAKGWHNADASSVSPRSRMVTKTHNKIVDKIEFAARLGDV